MQLNSFICIFSSFLILARQAFSFFVFASVWLTSVSHLSFMSDWLEKKDKNATKRSVIRALVGDPEEWGIFLISLH